MQFLCECMKIDCEIDCDARRRRLDLAKTVAVLPTGDIGTCRGRHLVRGAKYAARKKL